ncbi:hypothetical protein LAM69_22180, partial [Mycobacterium tuberculosis]|nr:hypothetical protein [Mycobacterium tuberculosis]
ITTVSRSGSYAGSPKHSALYTLIIEQALEDGVIERHEAEEIMVHHRRHLAAREEEIAAIITLFARKKK